MIEKIEVNLIPAEYRVREKHFSIDLKIMVPVLIALALNAVMGIAVLYYSSRIDSENARIANLRRQIEVNRTILDEIRTLERRQQEMQTKVDALKSIDVDRAKWIDALELYASVLPDNTWITSIEDNDNRITLIGMTEADAEVGLLMNRLFESPSVSGVNLVEMRDAGREGQLKSFTIQHSLVLENKGGN